MRKRRISLLDIGLDTSFEISMAFVQSTLEKINAGIRRHANPRSVRDILAGVTVLLARLRLAGYKPLSLEARLAAALHGVTRWLDQTRLRDPALDALIAHLWQWISITPEHFEAWYDYQSPALDGELPAHLMEMCVEEGVDPAELRELLVHLVEIVYGSLFGAADDKGSLSDLAAVQHILTKRRITLPPARHFASSRISDHGGWGRRMSIDDIGNWRNIRW